VFKIGEFAALTQIAVSQLRYYDEIDLFKPAHVAPDSGYRYYSADQIPMLDRIIVLRELGFSLDQIRDLQQQHITQAEIWRLLAERREQIIQNVREEIARLRQLETRLEQFANHGDPFAVAHRVIVKQVPAQPYLYTTSADAHDHETRIVDLYAARHEVRTRKQLLAVLHDTRAAFPYEIGYVVDGRVRQGTTLPSGMTLALRTLPAVQEMASLVYAGRWNDSHAATATLGLWLEQHDYRISGPFRKVFLQTGNPITDARSVVELQIPITPKA
jgi:DNA-binding transcriptional MerR regulator